MNEKPKAVAEPNVKAVSSTDLLAAICRHLDKRIEEMKGQFDTCQTPSQKNALGTAIITVNALAWTLNDTRKEMAANDRTERRHD